MKNIIFRAYKHCMLVCAFSIASMVFGQSSHGLNIKNSTLESSKNPLKEINKAELATSGNHSPFELVKGKKEDLKKRDAFSKHYINDNGSFTAIIGAGPIHYQKNGKWLDIDTKITSNPDVNYPYANSTNLMESYFGKTSNKGVKNKTSEGEFLEFLNLHMFWESNGLTNDILNSSNVPVEINGEKAIYPNLFGNISAEFTLMTGKRKLNYIIPNKQALGNIPPNANYLVFSEDIILPLGWSSQLTPSGISIKNQIGKEIFLYENPISLDKNEILTRESNTHFETALIGQTLRIFTKVKADWLLSTDRVYPIMVDPTVNYVPDNLTNWSRSVASDGYSYSNLYYGMDAGYFVRGFVKYNTSSIPIEATINSVVGFIRIQAIGGSTYSSNGFRFKNASDPTVESGTPLYNSANTFYSADITTNTTGWKNSGFNTVGINAVQNSIGSNISLAIDPAGSWYNTNYYQVSNHTSGDNRPYLAIDYQTQVQPTCTTPISPLNGSMGNGQSGLIQWNPSVGATFYDVYFGSTSAPPLVASGITSTNYTIGSCLLPDTTYYWKIVPKNSYGAATGCSTWSFTTDGKIVLYKNDFETAEMGYFGTSGSSVDGWYTNNNSGTGSGIMGYNNTWTIGNGVNAINGKSAGVSALYNGGLAGNFFQYWSDLGEIHRWIYRPFNMTGYRDIEVNFNWKCGGENNQDYGSVISSINGGANWLMHDQGGLYNDGKYWNSPSTIRSSSVILAESRNNQPNFLLGFKWDDLTGNGYSNDPSFVVDDIIIKACPFEGVINSDVVSPGVFEWTPTGSTSTTLSINGTFTCAFFQWEQSIDGGTTWINAIGGTGANTSSYTTPNDINVETWYRCKVYYGTACPGVYQDDNFKILIPSNCLTSTTWDGFSWSNGFPNDFTQKIIFDGSYQSDLDDSNTTGELIGCSLEVVSGNVTIASNDNVIIENEILVHSGANFTLNTDANLVQQNNHPTLANSGNIVMERHIEDISNTTAAMDYIYWSSPVTGQSLTGFSPKTPTNRIFQYNESNDYFTAAPESLFIPAKGYAFRAESGSGINTPFYSKTYQFTGVPHNGEIQIPIVKSTNGQGYNLVGNPYPSNVDVEKFFEANESLIYTTVFFWTNRGTYTIYQQGSNYSGTNYAVYNGTGGVNATEYNEDYEILDDPVIKAGQGFLVQKKAVNVDSNEFLLFDNSMRTTEEGIFYDKTPKNRFWLNLKSPQNSFNTMLIGYIPGATNDLDSNYDTSIFAETNVLYSLVGEEKLWIQGRNAIFNPEDVIPLGAIFETEGIYTIGLKKKEGLFSSKKIFLKDKLTGTIHDLTINPYSFRTRAGEYNERFQIIFRNKYPSTLSETHILNKVDIQNNQKNIVIKSNVDKILEVEIFNLSGESLYKNAKVNSKNIKISGKNLSHKVIIVRVLTERGEVVSKNLITYEK